MKYCISVDWFQYYCHRTPQTVLMQDTYFTGASKDKQGNAHTYYVGSCQEFHSMYRDSYTIYLDNQASDYIPEDYTDSYEDFETAMRSEPKHYKKGRKLSLVHIFLTPKMSSIDPNSVSVKVANRLLYKDNWSWYLHDILEALHIVIKNITRVDLCCDFQKFAYQDLSPVDFILRYTQDQTVAETETYIREGSNQYCVYGKKKMIAVNGEEEINDDTEVTVKSTFEYIRYGSRNSGVCTYLYNKSQELRDKKSKPWIRQRWDEVGFDESEGDIFRLEFSISAKGMCLRKADLKRGMRAPRARQVRKLCRNDVETQRSLEEVFMGYLDKYFSFRLVGKQKYRKDMKRIELFQFGIMPTLLPCYFSKAPNTGRSERNAALTIAKLQHQALDLSDQDQAILYQAQKVLEHLSIWRRDFKDHELEDTYFLLDRKKDVKLYADRLVKQALDEVYAFRQAALEDIKDLEDIRIRNDEDLKEWYFSDPNDLIAY